MRAIALQDVVALRHQLERGTDLIQAFPLTLGARTAADGLWRFYSESWPGEGITWWNSLSPWRCHWKSFLPANLYTLAEDIFGNQLFIVPGRDETYLLNHENAEFQSLYVSPVDLISNVLESGIDWIDFYADGSLAIARAFGEVPDDFHLHWTTPLILGGSLTLANVTLVSRDSHHIGHAKLWAQLSGLPAGTSIIRRG